MLVKYVRDSKRNPVATIVALSPDHIGVAVCCKKDHFNKKRGRTIAAGRARTNACLSIPERDGLYEVITKEVSRMSDRAANYWGLNDYVEQLVNE